MRHQLRPSWKASKQGLRRFSFVEQWLNLLHCSLCSCRYSSITYNLCFYAEVRMSAALMGPEVNTPVRMCRRLMWKLITESCSLKADKWDMEAICYIKTGMREVVLLLVCVSIRKAHVRPISKLCFQRKHSWKSKEKTNNVLDISFTVRPALQNFRWFLHFIWSTKMTS